MYKGDFTTSAVMRVGINIVRLPVGCPPGMRYPYIARHIFRFTESFQIIYFATGFINIKSASGLKQRHPGTVIPSVFQPVQTLNQNPVSGTMAYITYYSTHKIIIIGLCFVVIPTV